MNTENAITSRYDEVVFENRNKSYGAYSIRRAYDSNLTKGSASSFLFTAFLFGLVQAAMMLGNRLEITPQGPIVCITTTPPIIIKDPQAPKEIIRSPKANPNLTPQVVSTPVVDPPPVETQTTSSIGNENGPVTTAPSDGEGLPIQADPIIVKQPQTVDIAEVMPVFEGGTKALYKFLRKTLRYPKVAQQTGQEGTVLVRFIIDVTGAITGVEVIRSVGGVLDKEASRVIGLMPNWKPGMQHGSPVNVRMVLPIKFELDKE